MILITRNKHSYINLFLPFCSLIVKCDSLSSLIANAIYQLGSFVVQMIKIKYLVPISEFGGKITLQNVNPRGYWLEYKHLLLASNRFYRLTSQIDRKNIILKLPLNII